MKISKAERLEKGLKVADLRMQGMVYKAVDNYALDMEVLGYATTKRELAKFFNERIADTDGECYLIAQKWDAEKNGYVTIS